MQCHALSEYHFTKDWRFQVLVQSLVPLAKVQAVIVGFIPHDQLTEKKA